MGYDIFNFAYLGDPHGEYWIAFGGIKEIETILTLNNSNYKIIHTLECLKREDVEREFKSKMKELNLLRNIKIRGLNYDNVFTINEDYSLDYLKLLLENIELKFKVQGKEKKKYNNKVNRTIFDENFTKLKGFIEINGRLPEYKNKNEKRLYNWINTIRKRVNTLSDYEKNKLNNLQGWVWDKNKNRFIINCKKLHNFVITNSTYPIGSDKGEAKKMYNWMMKCISDYDKGKLEKYKIQELEKIPSWEWDIKDNSNFDEMFDLYNKFLLIKKRSPKKEDDEGFLYDWMTSMRYMYRNGKLSDDKINKLEQISDWTDEKKYNSFEDRYNEIVKFVNKNKRTPLCLKSKPEKEKTLARWLYQQNKKDKNGKLTKDQKEKLELIKTVFNKIKNK